MTRPHEQTELEFASKKVNDLLRREFPDRRLQFMTFVMDEGGGYMGYLATTRRIDAIRLMGEWLNRMLPSLSKKQFREMLLALEKERWPADNNDEEDQHAQDSSSE